MRSTMGTVVSMPDDCPALIVVILPAAKCMLETFHRDARAHPVCVSSHTKNLPGPSGGRGDEKIKFIVSKF